MNFQRRTELDVSPFGHGGADLPLDHAPQGRIKLAPVSGVLELAAADIDSELILQVFRNRKMRTESIREDHRVYGGGGSLVNPNKLYVVSQDTVKVSGVESRVKKILSRHTLLCGVFIARVLIYEIDSGNVSEVCVVVADQLVEGYSSPQRGQLILAEGKSCVTSPAIFCILRSSLKPYLTRVGGFLGVLLKPPLLLKYKIKTLGYYLARCCVNDSIVMYRMDWDVYEHLYAQRLGTGSSLNTEQAKRIIRSCGIKFNPKGDETTVLVTCELFRESSLKPIANVLSEDLFIECLTKIPVSFDPEVVVVSVPLGMLYSEECQLQLEVVDNGNLKLVKSHGATFEGGILKFDTAVVKPNPIFLIGPHAVSGATKSSMCSTNNVSKGFIRMTNSRLGESTYRLNAEFFNYFLWETAGQVTGFFLVAAKQYNAFSDWGMDKKDYSRLKRVGHKENVKTYASARDFIFSYWTTLRQQRDLPALERIGCYPAVELMKEFAEKDHAKKQERLTTFNNMVANPKLFDPASQQQFVSAKIKWETGKDKKLTRCFVSLGPEKVLQWPEAFEFMKHLMEEPVEFIHRGRLTKTKFVASPTREGMDQWAGDVYDLHKDKKDGTPNSDTAVWFHSDDGMLSFLVRIDDVIYRVTVCIDITKCDLSHCPGLFVSASAFMSFIGFDDSRILALFAQLQLDIKIAHPDRKVDEFLLFRVQHILLTSGFTGTTYVNNCGSLSIMSLLLGGIQESYETRDSLEAHIMSLAKLAGYEITVDAVVYMPQGMFIPEELSALTFLKYYPALSTCGTPIAVNCMSTVIRGLGLSDDLVNGLTRNREILTGLKSLHFDSLIERMSSDCQVDIRPFPCEKRLEVDDNFISSRYGLPIQELIEGVSLLTSLRGGYFVGHPGLDAILRVGYGLKRLVNETNGGTTSSLVG